MYRKAIIFVTGLIVLSLCLQGLCRSVWSYDEASNHGY